MGHSSLLGTEEAPAEAAGRDTAALGPGDNSDSGSDMMGITDHDDDVPDDEDADLAFIDAAQAGDPLEDEDGVKDGGPDQDPDDDGDAAEDDPDALEEDDNIPGSRGVTRTAQAHTPTPPGRPNPEPDVPAPVPGDSDEEIPPPADKQDSDERRPGRTAALLRRR